MSVSEACLSAINQEWEHYKSYSALVYPIDSNAIHAIAMTLIPQIVSNLYYNKMALSVNLLRHNRSCAIHCLPLDYFSNLASLFNILTYLFPCSKGVIKNPSYIGTDIEAYASRPLLAGAVTLILTGLFFGIGVIQHPVREMRRFRASLPFLLGCLFLFLSGAYVFYATCQLHIKDKVAAELSQKCQS